MENLQLKKKTQNKRKIRPTQNLTTLTEIIWKYQETQRLGAINEEDLQILTGWSKSRFKTVLNTLLNDPRSGVIRTPSGKIAYTW